MNPYITEMEAIPVSEPHMVAVFNPNTLEEDEHLQCGLTIFAKNIARRCFAHSCRQYPIVGCNVIDMPFGILTKFYIIDNS